MTRNMEEVRKKGNIVNVTIPELYPAGHPREGQPTGFYESIRERTMIHLILPKEELLDKLYCKFMRGRKPTRKMPFEMKYSYDTGKELLRKDFLVMQKVVIVYDSENYNKNELLELKKGRKQGQLIPICRIEVDGREVNADEVALNIGLSREDFNAWFFDIDAKTDFFEGYVLHFTNGFIY